MLVSPLGFEPDKFLRPVRELLPSHVVILHTTHPKTIANLHHVTAELDKLGIRWEDKLVDPPFNFVAWHKVFESAIQQFKLREDVVVNLTPGHGVAISTGAIAAARHSLKCVCYDVTERPAPRKRLHFSSPAILFRLDHLNPTDVALLQCLRTGPANVTELSSRARLEQSTTSTALKRLHSGGFLDRTRVSREIRYELRRGVDDFLEEN